MVPKTERFEMRVDEEILERIDRWRADHYESPSRAEAIRRLVEIGLERSASDAVHFSDGEKLLLIMLGDLFKQLKVKDPDIDPDFLGDVIHGGHYWAPKWQWPGIYHGEEDDPRALREVLDILEMWSTIERGFQALSKKDREKVLKEVEPFGEPKFRGFDGNNEAKHLGIAKFLIDKLDRYAEFGRRDLNSHMPSLAIYRRMLEVWEPIRRRMFSGVTRDNLTAPELVSILRAQRYPR